jgi:putative transposase
MQVPFVSDAARADRPKRFKSVLVSCQQLGCEIVEVNVQVDHVHLLVKVPPNLLVSELMGVLKGRTAIRLCEGFVQADGKT